MAEDGYSFGGTGGTGTSAQLTQTSKNDGLATKLVKVGTILSAGSSTWDGQLVESAIVFRDPKSGRLAMTFVGYGTTTGAQRAGVGLAYSDDGVTWTKYASNPILPHSASAGAADQNGASGPSIFYEDGVYYLYYIGLTATGYEAGNKSICLATATSLTGPWTRQGAKITASGAGWRGNAVWHPNVVKRGSTYYLFFNATAADNVTEAIGYATASSPSGPWTVDDTNSPILSPVASWESSHVGDPYVRQVGDMWVMDYYGGTAPAEDGIAVTLDSAFPLGWTKYANNPILTVGATGTFDAAHAHKPSILNLNGQILHYYTAENAGGTRGIALAMQRPVVYTAASNVTIAGSRSDGTALASLIAQLQALGLPLSDATTAATILAADDFTNRSGTLIGTASSHGETVLSWGSTSWAIASNKATFTGSADGGIGYQPATATTDNYTTSVTVGTVTGTFPLAIIPVYNTAVLGVLLFLQSTTWKIKVDNVVSGTTFNDVTIVSGDTFTVTKSGTSYTLKRIRAGVTTTIGTWTGIAPASVTGKMGYGGNGTNQPLEVTAFSVTTP